MPPPPLPHSCNNSKLVHTHSCLNLFTHASLPQLRPRRGSPQGAARSICKQQLFGALAGSASSDMQQ